MSGLEDALANQRVGQAPTSGVYSDELRDRIALLEQRNGQLDADLASSRLQHGDLQAYVARLERRLEDARMVSQRADRLAAELAKVQREQQDQYVALAKLPAAAEPFASSDAQLLESPSGLFVPIPEGHMLSLSVTPYTTAPEADGTT